MSSRFTGITALMLMVCQGFALAADLDGDGVPDEVDVCCNTPANIAVDAQGRPKGDLDLDCDVDQTDFGIFQANMTGSFPTCTPSPEACDGIDNDCDCLIDDNPTDGTTWYPDQDGDGYGATLHPVKSCSNPGPGYTQQPGDYNDNSPGVHGEDSCHPDCQELMGGPENCFCANVNPGTQSCGLGVCRVTPPLCSNGQPVTCVPNSGAASPEVCDNVDNDCDGLIDEDWNKQTDVDHCGSCTACPTRPNSTRVCNAGVCSFNCNAGFGNCDGVASNGCERSLQTDENNCGTCGHLCAGFQTCLAGVCR